MPDFDASELRDLPDEPNWREILDLSPTAWLERINVNRAEREDAGWCPLAMAANRQIEEGYQYAQALEFSGLLPPGQGVSVVGMRAGTFIGWWDRCGSRDRLLAILSEILADRHDGEQAPG